MKYGLEVSYNACGVFSHMLSDGADVWTVASPSREDILEAMSQAINKWPIDATRNINYRLCNCSNLKTLFIRWYSMVHVVLDHSDRFSIYWKIFHFFACVSLICKMIQLKLWIPGTERFFTVFQNFGLTMGDFRINDCEAATLWSPNGRSLGETDQRHFICTKTGHLLKILQVWLKAAAVDVVDIKVLLKLCLWLVLTNTSCSRSKFRLAFVIASPTVEHVHL